MEAESFDMEPPVESRDAGADAAAAGRSFCGVRDCGERSFCGVRERSGTPPGSPLRTARASAARAASGVASRAARATTGICARSLAISDWITSRPTGTAAHVPRSASTGSARALWISRGSEALGPGAEGVSPPALRVVIVLPVTLRRTRSQDLSGGTGMARARSSVTPPRGSTSADADRCIDAEDVVVDWRDTKASQARPPLDERADKTKLVGLPFLPLASPKSPCGAHCRGAKTFRAASQP